ncbi:MAG: sulfite exporter TauE/SafE family protein, partial [Candidatus Margulisbacteria bacterium]|nr:sulfite exporter TauE/SafE family protein [Candidatus Margulisiibacteriota bacterium]
YMLFVFKVRMDISVATGVAILALNSIVGFLFHSHLGGIGWEFLAFTAPGVLLGGFIGARSGRYIERRFSERGSENQGHSRLKLFFSIVILVDGVSILLYSYLRDMSLF